MPTITNIAQNGHADRQPAIRLATARTMAASQSNAFPNHERRSLERCVPNRIEEASPTEMDVSQRSNGSHTGGGRLWSDDDRSATPSACRALTHCCTVGAHGYPI